jgi:tol-pal system protein YbgF
VDTGGADDDASAAETGPGPNELHKLALDQFRRGAWSTARAGFSDLLRRYPTADVAPEAQFYVAETYASERNASAADEAYAGVVTRYPQSSRAPTALYKRARLKLAGGQRAEARALFDEVVRRYPRSDEAVLSRESLRTLDRAGTSGAAR